MSTPRAHKQQIGRAGAFFAGFVVWILANLVVGILGFRVGMISSDGGTGHVLWLTGNVVALVYVGRRSRYAAYGALAAFVCFTVLAVVWYALFLLGLLGGD